MNRSFYNIGFFGVPNIGDELLCKAVVERLRRKYPGCEISVMTRSKEVSEDYTTLGTKYVEGFFPGPRYYRHLKDHIQCVIDSDILVIGGGGLLSDYYTWQSILRYSIDTLCAILIGRPYVFVGLGVCEIRRRWLRRVARFITEHASCLYCRDKESADRVQKLSGRSDVLVGPDLANMLYGTFGGTPKTKEYALVNLRKKPPLDKGKVIEMLNELSIGVKEIVFLVAEDPDQEFYEQLLKEWEDKELVAFRIMKPKTVKEAIDIIRDAQLVIAERLHVNMVAMQTGRRLLTIDYESKINQFASMTGGADLRCSIDELGCNPVRQLLASCLDDRREMMAKLQEKAISVFDRSVEEGIMSEKCRLRTRLCAAGYIFLFLFFGLLWLAPKLTKRTFWRKRTSVSRPNL